MTMPAGWYPEPGDSSMERWWDGSQWTPATRPHVVNMDVPAAPATALTTAQRRPRPWLWFVIPVAVVAVGFAVALPLALNASSTQNAEKVSASLLHVNGQLTLTDPEGYSRAAQGSCEGSSGYNDISAGAEVVISSDSGRTLRIVYLSEGAPKATGCVFYFTAAIPDKYAYYGVTVTHRGTVKFTRSEMRAPKLTIGS